MHIGTFRKYLAITKQNKIDDIQQTNFPIAFPTFGCHPISQYSSLTGLQCKCSNSGVASGWHGWTMSKGPGPKGASRDREEKEE